jgi:23S rRNA pseudouridine955/2504/2580 synthase
MQDANSTSPRARTEEVTDGEQGQRIDNFLLRRAPGVPRSHVYRLIRTGQVRVNGGRIKPTRKLQPGDKVRIPPMHLANRQAVRVPDGMASELVQQIVFEHEDFFALAKPPGVAVHAGSGIAYGVIDALRQQLAEPKLELVHRLDRGTSGCLLIARDLKRNRELQNLFRQRQIDKRYLALVAGVWTEEQRTVDAPLLKNVQHAGERRVMVSADGQAAVSHFSCRSRYVDATLLDVSIDTGRTHQIRVHAKHMGYPVVGDTRYGNNRRNSAFRKRGLARLFLHASRLGFEWRGQAVQIDVPPDAAWQAALSAL